MTSTAAEIITSFSPPEQQQRRRDPAVGRGPARQAGGLVSGRHRPLAGSSGVCVGGLGRRPLAWSTSTCHPRFTRLPHRTTSRSTSTARASAPLQLTRAPQTQMHCRRARFAGPRSPASAEPSQTSHIAGAGAARPGRPHRLHTDGPPATEPLIPGRAGLAVASSSRRVARSPVGSATGATYFLATLLAGHVGGDSGVARWTTPAVGSQSDQRPQHHKWRWVARCATPSGGLGTGQYYSEDTAGHGGCRGLRRRDPHRRGRGLTAQTGEVPAAMSPRTSGTCGHRNLSSSPWSRRPRPGSSRLGAHTSLRIPAELATSGRHGFATSSKEVGVCVAAAGSATL